MEAISIHAPREGSDAYQVDDIVSYGEFQSTLPARGATIPHVSPQLGQEISIHAPREGSDSPFAVPSRYHTISIHAPREGSDLRWTLSNRLFSQFQSTLPARGATQGFLFFPTPRPISIHAPREGSDFSKDASKIDEIDFNPRSPRGERQMSVALLFLQFDFNPRSPRGERPVEYAGLARRERFQSTLPARGATWEPSPPPAQSMISIHAPREGSDVWDRAEKRSGGDFNPRSPRGERQGRHQCTAGCQRFQSTLPARGATADVHKYTSAGL